MLRGLLNSSALEERLHGAKAEAELPWHEGDVLPWREGDPRPPSRQRNLPMHLNADSRGDIRNRNQGLG